MEVAMGKLVMFLQFVAALLFSTVAGSVFGIWRGYDPTSYAAPTFLEMHQGAVRGLNVVLPGPRSYRSYAPSPWPGSPKGRWGVLALPGGIAIGGGRWRGHPRFQSAHQRTGHALDTLLANWAALRAAWWNWHLVRTRLSVLGIALLLAAIIIDRRPLH
jgi:hypothetical protein